MKVTLNILASKILLGVAVVGSSGCSVFAQTPTQEPALVTKSGEKSQDTADERYRIGPGDLLEIRVFNRPQLSRDAVRVDARGLIRMPLIETEIQAACFTEGEVARVIREHYLKYQRNPQVDVFIKEFNSQPAAVIGAVDKPGRFQLQRRVRLLELISLAGGPTDKAGKRVQIAHNHSRSLCRQLERAPMIATTTQDAALPEAAEYDVYNLNDTLRSDEASNPYVLPGDVITIPEAEQVYVVGNVFKPTTIPLKEPTTVSQAIAMAGGALPDTKMNRIRIIRKANGAASKAEIYVDLQEIVKQRAEDVALDPGDIVEVPVSSGKRMLRTLTGAIGPAFGNLPITVLR